MSDEVRDEANRRFGVAVQDWDAQALVAPQIDAFIDGAHWGKGQAREEFQERIRDLEAQLAELVASEGEAKPHEQ